MHFLLFYLDIFQKSVPLYCVFHSIRFKVNKDWSTAVLLFLCLYVLLMTVAWSMFGQCIQFVSQAFLSKRHTPYTFFESDRFYVIWDCCSVRVRVGNGCVLHHPTLSLARFNLLLTSVLTQKRVGCRQISRKQGSSSLSGQVCLNIDFLFCYILGLKSWLL